ncbi:MAG: C_GCAxxG_C_C family protein [Firmicutes bacterium]|nr:C_GCAxxG_C_C family protein [Bacillota bacterium]
MIMKRPIAENKTTEELMVLADELGRGYFRQGLNCTECVLRTFMDIYGVEFPDEIICMATGFGGGMGHTKNTCGAITGAVMALGLLKGRRNPFGPKEEMGERIKHLQQDIYPVFGEMVEEIEAKYGTLICREMSQPFGDFDSKPRMRNCMEIIGYCAQLAVKYAEQQ